MFDTTPEGIVDLVKSGESQTVEFKSRFPNSQVVARVLSSFANTRGGILLIGVDDKGEIVGISELGAVNAHERLHEIASSLLPWPIEIGVIEISGKYVVYASVDKAPEQFFPVMTSRGELFQRGLSGETRARKDDWFNQWSKSAHFSEDGSWVGGSNKVTKKDLTIFVAMSFREEEEPALVDYFQAMERAVKASELPIKLNRVDLVEGDYEISQQVMDEIDKADIIIADFTLSARNVYFELGYARGKRKRVIQMARKGTELEFDTRNWRTLFYRNAAELEEKLLPALKVAHAELAVYAS